MSDVGPLQRECARCHQVRPLGWFALKGGGRRRSECRECGRGQRVKDAAVRRGRKGGGVVRAEEIERIGEVQGWRCRICGKPIRAGWEVDHVLALARGGRHEVGNLQLLCGGCNRRKGCR